MNIDFALVNGNVNTLNSNDDTAEAIAVAGGRILSVGTTKSIEELLDTIYEKGDILKQSPTLGSIRILTPLSSIISSIGLISEA